MLHHIKFATRHLVFWSLIVSAVGLTALRLLLLGIDNYKADLSARVSELVGAPVKVGHIRANMRGYNPELVLKGIEILSSSPNLQFGGENPAIQLKEIRLGINLLDALVNRDRLASTWVTLVGAKLTVKRKQDGSIAIVGLKASDEQPLWLLQGSKYEVLQSEISWQDERSQNKLAVVGKVDFAIMNDAQQRHQLNIRVKLPKKYGDELRVSMDLKGNVFKPSSVDGAVFVEGKNLNLAEWVTGGLPFAVAIHSGVGDVRIWGGLQRSQLVSLVGDAQLQRLQLTRPAQGTFPVKQLKTRFYWGLDDNQWRLDVPHFLLETAEKKWPAAVFSVSSARTEDNSLHKLGLFVGQVDVQEVSRVLQFFAPLPEGVGMLLAQAQLKGVLEQLSLFADMDEKHFAVNGKFTKINIAPLGAIPGIENLSGQLKGSDQQGSVVLATKDARMTTSGLFREALRITKLDGTIAWRQTPDDWIVSSPIIKLDSPDLQTKSRLHLSIPKADGQTFMDLQTAFVGDDISKARHYLPTAIMGKPVVDWLDHAFISGRIPKGGMLFYGNLSDFPFTGGQGIFETLFEVDQLELAYHPQWPHLTGLGGEVLFLRDSLQVDLLKGESNKVKINQAKITIPALSESEDLQVHGKLGTEILQGLKFLQQTPLNSPVDKLLGAVEPQGNTEITLDLKLPLVDGGTSKVNGYAQLGNARLKVKALDLEVNQINGALKFNEQGVYSDTITAAALGRPIQINVKSSERQTTVNVTGRADVSQLRQQFKIPGWQVAQGAADYQLKLQLPYSGSSPELLVQSKLAGVALDLPGTLAKAREQQRPLSLTFNLADEAFLPINLNYDNQLQAAIKFNIKQQRIESGNVLVGAGNVAQSQEAGIKLEIKRERLDLQDWLGLASSLVQGKDSETTGAANNLREIIIHTRHGLWKKADLGFIDLELKPKGNYWAGGINSSIAKGTLKIPVDLKGADSISLTMDELQLSALKQLNYQGDALEPASVPDVMPLLAVTSQKTLWQSVDLGQLRLQTERIANGIAFKRLELVGSDQTLVLSGDWKINGKKSETHAQGSLDMPRAGQLLAKLGISKDLTETSAVIGFTGAWNAAPYQFSLTGLQGKIDVDLKGGRILSIEPGFGRVLGMLAMAQWIKRLQLDFSDVYKEGLTFNSIKGHFDLLNGKAVTRDLVIDAVPAKITITGETDFINRSVNQVANVVPKSADAVPIAGTIMGKVAAIIGQSLTGKDQEGFFFGSQYLVKGDWGSAQIVPLHENDGLLQKTWNGITGFPWLQQPKNQ